ncbi:unnamed protein product [Hymenolepis diminuta]|nr:unnamed protein product [Hymenolepis diminuta]
MPLTRDDSMGLPVLCVQPNLKVLMADRPIFPSQIERGRTQDSAQDAAFFSMDSSGSICSESFVEQSG